MERFMQELMVVTIHTRERQTTSTIALSTLPEFQPEEADPLKMLDAWRNRAEWYEYSSGR